VRAPVVVATEEPSVVTQSTGIPERFPAPVRSIGRRNVAIAQGTLAQRRRTALGLGWNDAAWGRPRHAIDVSLATWYQRGYAGGLVFREKDRQRYSPRM
jgi:hypothetical protein